MRVFFAMVITVMLTSSAQAEVAGVWREMSDRAWMKVVPQGICKVTLNQEEGFYDFQAPDTPIVSRLNDAAGTYVQDGVYLNTYGVYIAFGDKDDYATFIRLCDGLPGGVSFPKELCVDPNNCGPAQGKGKGRSESSGLSFYTCVWVGDY